MRHLRLVLLGAVTALVLAAAASAGTGTSVIYDTTLPNGPATNLPSVGFEATSTSELGADVTFAAGSAGRSITHVTVSLSSWACQSGNWYDGTCLTTPGATFSQPITLNIYTDDGTKSFTQTFAIPYRPSAATADQCDGDTTAWYQPAQGHGAGGCYHGILANVTFSISGVTVPDDNTLLYGITYDTRDFGYQPTGVAGPADSLNVALNTTTDSTTVVWLNSQWSGAYCDGGVVLGTWRADGEQSCWAGRDGVPAVQFKASN